MSKETFYKNNRRSIKDIPLKVIEHWLNDDSSEVRQAAIYYCEQNGTISIRDKSFPDEKTAL